MTYAGAPSATGTVKPKMLGFVKKRDVLRAIHEGQEAIYAANVADYDASQNEIIEIALTASRPSAPPTVKPIDVDSRLNA